MLIFFLNQFVECVLDCEGVLIVLIVRSAKVKDCERLCVSTGCFGSPTWEDEGRLRPKASDSLRFLSIASFPALERL